MRNYYKSVIIECYITRSHHRHKTLTRLFVKSNGSVIMLSSEKQTFGNSALCKIRNLEFSHLSLEVISTLTRQCLLSLFPSSFSKVIDFFMFNIQQNMTLSCDNLSCISQDYI